MRVHVTSISIEDSKLIVGFQCASGEGMAVWRSTRPRPEASRDYQVELDITVVLKLGENASILADSQPSLQLIDGRVQVTAAVENVDEYGMVFLRLSPDCIVMVESVDSTLERGNIVRTTLDAKELQVSVIGI